MSVRNKTYIGVILLDEEDLAKRSFIKRLYGSITLLILLFLFLNFINFLIKVITTDIYLNVIADLSGRIFFHTKLNITEFVYITLALVALLTISFFYLLFNQRVGLIKEIKGFGKKYIMTFSEAFYIGFLVSLVLILLAPLNPPTKSVPLPVVIYYSFSATVFAPFFEESIFRLLLLLVPIAVKEKMKFNRDKITEIVFRGKDNIDNYDVLFALISSLSFGLAHLWGGWEFNKLFQATFLGLFLAYVAIRGGIVSSIVFHWAWNTLATFIVIVLIYDPLYQLYLLLIISLLYFVILGLGILGIIIFLLRKFGNMDI